MKKETLQWKTWHSPRPPCCQVKIKFCMGVVVGDSSKFHQNQLSDFQSVRSKFAFPVALAIGFPFIASIEAVIQ